MTKFWMTIALMVVAGSANSQAYFECGSVACPTNVPPWNIEIATGLTGDITGINDINVGGDLFDVTFTSTAPATSPFVVSDSTAAAGQPLTGIDAATAIWDFFAVQEPPYAGGYDYADDPGPDFITAFAPAGALGSEYYGSTELFDLVQTTVGGGFGNPVHVGEVGNNSDGRTAAGNSVITSPDPGTYYTVWTPIAAPEIDTNSTASGFALLLGGLAVLRGRRRQNLLLR